MSWAGISLGAPDPAPARWLWDKYADGTGDIIVSVPEYTAMIGNVVLALGYVPGVDGHPVLFGRRVLVAGDD